LIACYSVHPLVPQLQTLLPHTVVTGIFEASVLTALSLLKPGEKWGVITTGPFWEKHLSDGAMGSLGADNAAANSKFAGVQPTGLNASDFHQGVEADVVKRKIRDATWKLLNKGNVTCILMGCASMAGLDLEIRKAAEEAQGHDFGFKILHVVDGVAAGMVQIEQSVRQRRLSSFSDAAPDS
jgi:Asp/Glu/hydantoin racemase